MADNERPLGQRFSYNYLSRPEALKDGPRIRKRLAVLFSGTGPHDHRGYDCMKFVSGETGEDIEYHNWGPNWDTFFRSCPLDTLLDSITIISRWWTGLERHVGAQVVKNWITGCERILREEQSTYTLDAKGGVHPYVDAAFHSERLRAVAALSGPRFGTAASSLEKAYDSLHGTQTEGRDAIRYTFDAAETIYKMLVPNAPRLTASDAKSKLAPLIDQWLGGDDPVAKRASHQMLNSLCDWVDAAHHYRHAPGEAEPPQPPKEVWQLLVSSGTAFVRWLAQLDRGRAE